MTIISHSLSYVGYLQCHKRKSPSNNLLSQILEHLRIQWLGKQICALLRCIYWMNTYQFIPNGLPKVMINLIDVLGTWSHSRCSCKLQRTRIVLKSLAEDLGWNELSADFSVSQLLKQIHDRDCFSQGLR